MVAKRTCVTTRVFTIKPSAPNYSDMFDYQPNVSQSFATAVPNSEIHIFPETSTSDYDLQMHLKGAKYQSGHSISTISTLDSTFKAETDSSLSRNNESQRAIVEKQATIPYHGPTSGCYEPD